MVDAAYYGLRVTHQQQHDVVHQVVLLDEPCSQRVSSQMYVHSSDHVPSVCAQRTCNAIFVNAVTRRADRGEVLHCQCLLSAVHTRA